MSKAPVRRPGTLLRNRPPIAVFRGSGCIEALLGYRRAVLRPEMYSRAELTELEQGGTLPLAHLSLAEGTVRGEDAGWPQRVRSEAESALDSGFAGLFLDRLDVGPRRPEVVLGLVAALREACGSRYLMANGGFALLPRLAELVDGVLFESFTTRCLQGGYAPWPPDVLDEHGRVAERLLGYDLNLHALDYAEDDALASYAVGRARQFGMTCFVSDTTLTRLPPMSVVEAVG